MEKIQIIGITGFKRSGKDLVASWLHEQYGYSRMAFADPLKRGVAAIFGLSDDQVFNDAKDRKDPFWGVTPREILQIMGTEVMRQAFPKMLPGLACGSDFWIKRMERQILESHAGDIRHARIAIPDVRFSNEYDLIRRLGGFVIKIVRLSQVGKSVDGHASESDDVPYDELIEAGDGQIDLIHQKTDEILRRRCGN